MNQRECYATIVSASVTWMHWETGSGVASGVATHAKNQNGEERVFQELPEVWRVTGVRERLSPLSIAAVLLAKCMHSKRALSEMIDHIADINRLTDYAGAEDPDGRRASFVSTRSLLFGMMLEGSLNPSSRVSWAGRRFGQRVGPSRPFRPCCPLPWSPSATSPPAWPSSTTRPK